ncbi:MAG: aspartate aminotransferase family protein [Polyangiaceae bacterium]|jgi:sphinganine-1-phosphate aldolase|nr:aspartate aminotransferase family protein [Polyangiaceae bacterium]
MHIPSEGLSKSEVLRRVEAAREHDWPWREGKLFAYVFEAGPEVEEVGKQAYMAYLTENGLDPTTFPSLLKFENDLVDMARRHLGGDERVVGNFTSGGTESILLAVKTARDWFRARRPGVRPQMLVPITAHAAFHKAAHYFDVDTVIVDVDPETFRADPAAMKAAISDRTMLLVASACSYAHGVVDPVTEIAALAKERGLLCHVDGCMGGFMLPYFQRLGAAVPAFDFRVPGVTSMSMDFHKYGLCPKGASVVLYASEELRKFQIYACSEWTGYTMINNTIQSSKSGGPLAAAWAVLNHLGEDGYTRIAKDLLAARDALVAGIDATPGLRMLGRPDMSMVGFTSDEISVFALSDELKARGWHVQVQLAHGPSKENIHMTINPGNTRWIADFVAELPRAVEAVRAAGGGPTPPKELAALLAQQIESDPSGEGLKNVVASVVGSGGQVPGKMAEVNALLNELPRKVQEKMLVAFVGQMFTPRSEG